MADQRYAGNLLALQWLLIPGLSSSEQSFICCDMAGYLFIWKQLVHYNIDNPPESLFWNNKSPECKQCHSQSNTAFLYKITYKIVKPSGYDMLNFSLNLKMSALYVLRGMNLITTVFADGLASNGYEPPASTMLTDFSMLSDYVSPKWLTRSHDILRHLECQRIEAETNGRLFTGDVIECIFLNEDVWIVIKISLELVPKGSIYNNPH